LAPMLDAYKEVPLLRPRIGRASRLEEPGDSVLTASWDTA